MLRNVVFAVVAVLILSAVPTLAETQFATPEEAKALLESQRNHPTMVYFFIIFLNNPSSYLRYYDIALPVFLAGIARG